VYYGKKRIVAGGVPVVTDRLGTVRSDTQGDSYAYYPYGEERTSTVNGLYKFATYFRDTVGQDYADQRYYNAGVGRFWSPDRGGGITDDPGSMNKYAYVQGDPINFADPHGTEEVYVGGGLTLDCGDDADSIYDGTCVVADGGGGSEGCGGYADGFADNFLGWPAAPGCPVDYDGPPAPPQLTCGYTGNKTKNGSFNNVQVPGGSGNAFVDPISLMFQAGGGTGSYTFSVTQTVARSGTVDYSSGYVYTGPGTVGPDTLLPVESQQNGSKFTFSDVPGVWASMFGGTITAANFTATLQTTVTVTSGTQTVTCATVSWVATVSATTGKKGKLKINGRAKVTNVVQGGGQL
jgi:RHS repeat-associated protein